MAAPEPGKRRLGAPRIALLAALAAIGVAVVYRGLEHAPPQGSSPAAAVSGIQHDAAGDEAHAPHDASAGPDAPRADGSQGDGDTFVVTRVDGSTDAACAARGQLHWSRFIKGNKETELDALSAGHSLVVTAGSVESRDAVFAFDTDGRELWKLLATPIQPRASASIAGVAVDRSDRVRVLLSVAGAVGLGGLTLRAPTPGLAASCVAAFNASGEGLWSTCLGFGDVELENPALDSTGALLFTGRSSKYDLQCGDAHDPGWSTTFLAKVDVSGKTAWCRHLGESTTAVSVTNEDSVVVAGTVGLDPGFLQIRVLDANGSQLHEQRFPAVDPGVASVVAASGAIYLGGSADRITFGRGALTVRARGWEDAYIVKLDATGRPLWAKRFGDRESQGVDGIAVVPGAVISVVNASGLINFGGRTFGKSTPVLPYPYDLRQEPGPVHLYLAGFEPSGAHLFSEQLAIADYARNLAVDGAGDVVVVGQQEHSGFIAAYCW